MKHLKHFLFLFLIVMLSMAMTTQKKTRIVFFGDSITQMGVNEGGYIKQMQATLQQRGLADQYELMGAGISGNKVYDLYLRMEDDVLAKNPDAVVIWIGVNDVWHKTSGTGTDADKFERFYDAIIKKLQAKNIKVLLATPAAIGERTDFTNPQDGDMNLYASIIRKVAAKNNVGLIDLRKAFLDYNLKNNTGNKESGILTTDRVHLNAAGNNLVAEKMLETLIKK